MGASWWQPVVLCNYSGVKPDWFWVRDKVKSVCGQLLMKITKKGEVFLCFKDDCAREKVLAFPQLHSWEGTYSFRSWEPMDGGRSPLEEVWSQIPRSITVDKRGYLAHILVVATRMNPFGFSDLVGDLPDLRSEVETIEPHVSNMVGPLVNDQPAPNLPASSLSSPPVFGHVHGSLTVTGQNVVMSNQGGRS
ncbi:hypothetical protein FRX31_014689 [Thalictrum thalictroides]|uniref:DUF4283 domain-containing protein n=1 Tax=Thalictrum thalictroides TaxID=46969 RepID=A0A7J6WE57_THATH|nr:hypothetical protein FRX31_014689 [Thalictrum thalictroides]